MAEGYEPDYRSLFNKTLSALAEIDKALGLPEDGQNTLLNTLNAIHYYKALAHGDSVTAERLKLLIAFEGAEQLQAIEHS